jgi:hypothetical protein
MSRFRIGSSYAAGRFDVVEVPYDDDLMDDGAAEFRILVNDDTCNCMWAISSPCCPNQGCRHPCGTTTHTMPCKLPPQVLLPNGVEQGHRYAAISRIAHSYESSDQST